jgi:hypothetical protein
MVHELNNDFEVEFHQVIAFFEIVYLQLQYYYSKHIDKSSFANFDFLVHISKILLYIKTYL